MATTILEVPTFSAIPSFVPLGTLYFTRDTLDIYVGTGSSVGPAVTFVAGGGVSAATPNLLQISTAGVSSPAPAYAVNEAPSGQGVSVYTQDVNNQWHQHAGIDTTTANAGSGDGPADPVGTLTFYRRTFFRDSTAPTQYFKNAFTCVNHCAQVGTLSTNQDRAFAVNMINPYGVIVQFSIASNVVTFYLSNKAPLFVSGHSVSAAGLSTGTYLNGVALTVSSVAIVGAYQVVTASSGSFTHADLGATADSGELNLTQMYSMAGVQCEVDVNGTPNLLPRIDGELSAGSFQLGCSATHNFAAPDSGVCGLRVTCVRSGAGIPGAAVIGFYGIRTVVNNNNAADLQSTFMVGTYSLASDATTGTAGHGFGVAFWAAYPGVQKFSKGNYGLYVEDFQTGTTGNYAIYVVGGISFFGGPIMPGQYTVAGLPSGTEGMTAYATNGRKSAEGAGSGTGVPVYFSNGQWRVYSTDAQATA